MKRSTKKGFTIVELVIVIAIIAILAAVLIPTFASLIQKANESKDTQLVKNLNTALAADNKEHKTMTDALDAAVEFGYDVGKINASATNKEILWDSKNDVFCYYDTNTKTPEYIPETSLKNGAVAENETYKLWKIYTEAPTEQTFSIYWNSTENFTAPLTVGFDAGKNTAITELKYERTGETVTPHEVVIRTNGGKLTIDAEKDTVSRYGNANSVLITAVAPSSYHEFGRVIGEIKVVKGNVVVENGAEAVYVVLAGAEAKTTVESGAKVESVVATDLKYYANVTNNNGEATSVDNTKTITNDDNSVFAGGDGTADFPFLVATGEQALNMKNAKGYFKFVADVVVTDEIYMSSKTYVVDLNGHSVTLKYADDVKPNNGSVFYIGGKGGNLTINDSSNGNGKVIGSDKSYANKVTCAVRAGNYGKLTINGGHFYGTSAGTSCIFVMTSIASGSKATVVINGGIFETASPANGIYYVLNHQDSATTGCTITVNGGKFKNYEPGKTAVDPVNAKTGTISLGTGCTTTSTTDESENIWYTVSKSN